MVNFSFFRKQFEVLNFSTVLSKKKLIFSQNNECKLTIQTLAVCERNVPEWNITYTEVHCKTGACKSTCDGHRQAVPQVKSPEDAGKISAGKDCLPILQLTIACGFRTIDCMLFPQVTIACCFCR